MREYEVDDARLPDWPWSDIYPCPVTGCWLHTFTVSVHGLVCRQPACCNPAHWITEAPFPYPLDRPWSAVWPLELGGDPGLVRPWPLG